MIARFISRLAFVRVGAILVLPSRAMRGCSFGTSAPFAHV